MTLSVKILLVGIMLAVISVATGQYLAHQAKKNIPSMLRDCSSIKPNLDLDKYRKEALEDLEIMESLGYQVKKITDEELDDHARGLMRNEALLSSILSNPCEDHNRNLHRMPDEKTKAAIEIAGVILTLSALPWIFTFVLPWSWNFLLQRIREVSKAITGK